MWTLLSRRAIPRAVTGVCALVLVALPTIGEAREGRAGIRERAPNGHFNIREDVPRFFTIAAVLAKRDGIPVPPNLPGTAQRLASADATVPSTLVQAPRTPFGERGFHLFVSSNATIATKWGQVQSSWFHEQQQIEACRRGSTACTASARQFLSIVRGAVRLPVEARPAYVNRRVNASVRYLSDWSKHGVGDHWESPLRALGGAGDCEEYAIVKHHLLIAAGVPASRLRIVLVRDNRAGEDHAVLVVRDGMNWQVLDNRWNRIHATHELAHYRPVVSIGVDGLHLFAAPYASATEPSKTMSPSSGWIHDEGYQSFIGEEP